MTATTTRTPRTPWSSHSQNRTTQKPTTTPVGLPTRTPASAGQPIPPLLSSKIKSPTKQQPDPRTSSPSYFGIVVEPSTNPIDSHAGGHVNNNWSPPTSTVRSAVVQSPKAVNSDTESNFELFRRQSETNPFSLSHSNLSQFSLGHGTGRLTISGNSTGKRDMAALDSPESRAQDRNPMEALSSHQKDLSSESPPFLPHEQSNLAGNGSFFGLPRNASPVNMPLQRNNISYINDRDPRLSLPQNKIDPPSPGTSGPRHHNRAETLPSSMKQDGPSMISVKELGELLSRTSLDEVLLLDLRVTPQYMQARINGAMNLCIPTTLLKRPSYNVQKLADTFTKTNEKNKFSHWRDMNYIIVYDANSAQLKDATSSVNMLKKFTTEGWHGASFVVRGGFATFSRECPNLVDKSPSNDDSSSGRSNLSIDSNVASTMPVAGGCPMPATQTAANPFFGNIRQNMDLIGGVGQMPIKYPSALTPRLIGELPAWIREAIDEKDKGKSVADKFLRIEKTEQVRMQKALSGHVHYGSPNITSPQHVQIAGIEKGTKNRYKDMLPYDHSRVRLQTVPSGGCDYINASHVKSEWSNRHYIATQAPVPATFEDFWRLVWEQDARVVVMLTAESEGGQRKSHPYWLPDNYGPLKLKSLSEKKVSLEPPKPLQNKSLAVDYLERPGLGRRRATNPQDALVQEPAGSPTSEIPHVIVRKLTLSHTSYPFQPLREITQLQYSSWPDFGAPAHPAQVLSLVEHCNAVARSYASNSGRNPNLPEPAGERPIVVHCSAGCGRTGTFCTVDSVLDQLKSQRMAAARKAKAQAEGGEEMDMEEPEWSSRDDIDLVAKTVEDLRSQRLSMVQTLRQFVLCYETVLEWLVREMPERVKRDAVRRSYHG